MKRITAIILTLSLVFTFAACGKKNNGNGNGNGTNGSGGKVTLKVWGSQEDNEMLTSMLEDYKTANPDTEYSIELGVVSEADAKSRYLEDPAAAADVFAFSNDQLKDLVSAGALYEISGSYKDTATSGNTEGSVGSATLGGKLYGFPMTADNGYFLYYDNSVFSEEDVKTLDGMMAKANEVGKSVFMDVSNGYYIVSFFLGAGCTLTVDENGKQVCDFNSERGLAAAEAIKKFTADPAFVTGDDAVFTGGIGTTIAAGISGTWNAAAVSEILGENFAATKLPTFTIGEEQVQMSSFMGSKLVGVNKLTANPVEAMKLASFLTNEKNQITRFNTRQLGPSNINAAKSEAVLANKALSALALQNQYAVSQNDVLGNFWSPAEAFGTSMETKDYSASLQEQLDAMVAQIVA